MVVIRFEQPFSMIVAGPSYCGKTQFVSNVIKNKESLFQEIPVAIYYFYAEFQDKYKELEKYQVIFKKDLPSSYHPFADKHNRSVLIVLDDLSRECMSHEETEKLFQRTSHHRNMSVILITQNLYTQGKNARNLSLNAKILVIFKQLRDKAQVLYLARQVAPRRTQQFLYIYNDAISYQKHGYLLVDLASTSDERFRFRTNIFPQEPLVVYEFTDE